MTIGYRRGYLPIKLVWNESGLFTDESPEFGRCGGRGLRNRKVDYAQTSTLRTTRMRYFLFKVDKAITGKSRTSDYQARLMFPNETKLVPVDPRN